MKKTKKKTIQRKHCLFRTNELELIDEAIAKTAAMAKVDHISGAHGYCVVQQRHRRRAG